jgi:DNA-binding PadR family transcriptional regulator
MVKSPRATPLALAVLELLHEGDMHPYEMLQLLRDRGMGRVVKLTAGSLYHTVERLARDGLVEPAGTDREGRRPERTLYTITDAGADAFSSDVSEMLRAPAEEYPSFIAAIAFMHQVGRERAIKSLEFRQVMLDALIASEEKVVEHVRAKGVARLHLLEHEYRANQLQSQRDWVAGIVAELRDGTLPWTVGVAADEGKTNA